MTEPENKFEEMILRLTTPEQCEVMAKNCEKRGRSDLAQLALHHAIELRASTYGAETDAEREAIECVHAYEETLYAQHGKRIRASRTWKMIKDHGVLGAVERAVNKPEETEGYKALVDLGLERFVFECVVVKHPELFEEETVDLSRSRIESWNSGAQTP